MRVAAVIPAYQAERTVGEVVREVTGAWPNELRGEGAFVFVVDDGSTDATRARAQEAGAFVIAHPQNRGKGAALRSGLAAAWDVGFDAAVSVDADGQHPADEAARLALRPESGLLLGIRDLAGAGAPRANQISNRISNFFLSTFSRQVLADTQCGLRRYPLPEALELGGEDAGYAYEAEIILRAIAAHVPIVEVPVRVFYPPEDQRVTHFHSVRDPARIVHRVVRLLWLTRGMRRAAPGDASHRRRSSPRPSSAPTAGEESSRVGAAQQPPA